jgi:hypothetical protein
MFATGCCYPNNDYSKTARGGKWTKKGKPIEGGELFVLDGALPIRCVCVSCFGHSSQAVVASQQYKAVFVQARRLAHNTSLLLCSSAGNGHSFSVDIRTFFVNDGSDGARVDDDIHKDLCRVKEHENILRQVEFQRQVRLRRTVSHLSRMCWSSRCVHYSLTCRSRTAFNTLVFACWAYGCAKPRIPSPTQSKMILGPSYGGEFQPKSQDAFYVRKNVANTMVSKWWDLRTSSHRNSSRNSR